MMEGLPIIRTKIMIPAMRTHMVHRLHLINSIEKGLTQGLVLISAPPGYGKTTLAADWARQSRFPVAWLSLDAQDNDLEVMNRYLSTFLETYFPSQQQLLTEFSSLGNPEHEYRTLLIAILNACTEMDSDFTLILDDYHVIQNPQIHEGLLFLLEHMPPHLRLMLITRVDPPFPMARLRANNHVCELHAADLVFSLKEAAEFLTQTMQLRINETQIGQFLHRTEGWVTGLQLAALSQNDAANPTLQINQNLVQQYIIEEIYSRQPAEIQDFLLYTSMLGNLSAPLCDHLLENRVDSQKILQYLDRCNLLLLSLDNEGKWYRYHPLFRDALQRLLNERHPEAIAPLHIRASEWCDENGLYEEALSHALVVKDYPRTVDLLMKYALLTIQHGNILDLLRWIKKIPTELIESSPLLCLVYSWDLILSLDLENGKEWLNKASALLDGTIETDLEKRVEPDLRGGILAVRSILAAGSGDGELAISLSRQALDLLSKENSFSRSFALLDQGVALTLNGKLSEAVKVLQETIHMSQISGNWMVMMIARCNLGEVLISRGDLSKALTLFKQSLANANPPKSIGSGFEGLILIEIGEIYLMRNQLSEANDALSQGTALAKSWLPMLYELDAHLHMAHLQHCQGNFEAARNELSCAREIADLSESNLDDRIIDLVDCHDSLQRGEIKLALLWAQKNDLFDEEGLKQIRSLPFSIYASVCLVFSRLLLQLGIQDKNPQYFERAVEILKTSILQFQEMEYKDSLIEAWLLLALIYQENGDADGLLNAIQTALSLAEPEGFRQVFLDEGIAISRLLTRYLAFQKKNKLNNTLPTRNFVTDLLFRLTGKESSEEQTREETHPLADSAPIELLTPRELEVLKLAAEGRSNQEIALEFHLSINTVKRHLNNIFLKLGAANRTQAIALAHQQGWLH